MRRALVPRALVPRLCAMACAMALSLTARDLRAAEPNRAMGEQTFREAKDLLKAGKVHEACERFAISQNLDPQLGTSLNLAACLEREGRTASALLQYRDLVEAATRRNDTARVRYGKERIAQLEKSVPRARLDVERPKDVRAIRVDDQDVPRASWSAAIPLDPGEHTLAIATADGKRHESRFTLANKPEEQPVRVAVSDAAAPPSPPSGPLAPASEAPPPPPPAANGSSGGSALRTVGFITMGLGALGVGAGAGFGIHALGLKGEVDDHCQGNLCDRAGFEAQEDARTAGTISTSRSSPAARCWPWALRWSCSRRLRARAGAKPRRSSPPAGAVG